MRGQIEWKALALASGAAFLIGWGVVGVGHGIGLAAIVAGGIVYSVKHGPTFWSEE